MADQVGIGKSKSRERGFLSELDVLVVYLDGIHDYHGGGRRCDRRSRHDGPTRQADRRRLFAAPSATCSARGRCRNVRATSWRGLTGTRKKNAARQPTSNLWMLKAHLDDAMAPLRAA